MKVIKRLTGDFLSRRAGLSHARAGDFWVDPKNKMKKKGGGGKEDNGSIFCVALEIESMV